eukprot:2570516-Pyramimonas_sp.AAC.1
MEEAVELLAQPDQKVVEQAQKDLVSSAVNHVAFSTEYKKNRQEHVAAVAAAKPKAKGKAKAKAAGAGGDCGPTKLPST